MHTPKHLYVYMHLYKCACTLLKSVKKKKKIDSICVLPV